MAKMKEMFLFRNAFSNRKISYGIQIEIPDATVVEIFLTLSFRARTENILHRRKNMFKFLLHFVVLQE